MKLKIILGVMVSLIVVIGSYFGFKKDESQGFLGARLTQAEKTIFATSTNSNYTSLPNINVNDFQNIGLTMMANNASGTLRFACSMQDIEPQLGIASSTTNRWDYVEAVDLMDGNTIDGDTGIVLNNTTDIRQFELNVNNFKWCSAVLSGNTTPSGYGTTTVYLKPAD